MTPEMLVAAGQAIFNGKGGCFACHGTPQAPPLVTDHAGEGPIGRRCATRQPGMDCNAYLYESLTKPEAYVVKGFEPIMSNFSFRFSPDQVWSVVAFLESQGGQVAVTSAQIEGTRAGGRGAAAASPSPVAAAAATPAPAPAAAPPAAATMDPRQLIKEQCLSCHAIDREGSQTGPSFDGVGRRLTADRIRQKILDPAHAVTSGATPATFGQRLTGAQLEALVQFLATRQ